MIDYKFLCYGTYKESNKKCLVTCVFKKECERITKINKLKKELKNEKNKQK